MKKLLVIACILSVHSAFAQDVTGEVVGTIVEKNGTPIIGANVFIIDQDRKYQAMSATDGRFRISGIPAGEYAMNIRFLQDTMRNIPVNIPMDGFYNAGTVYFDGATVLGDIIVEGDGDRIKLVYGSIPIKEISGEEIEQSPVKFSVAALATSINSDVKMADDGELIFRGARKGDMVYLLDGIKGREISNVPSCAIGRMMVYTGGLPAKYGDTLGGVIVLETKSYFDLYRAWEKEELKNK